MKKGITEAARETQLKLTSVNYMLSNQCYEFKDDIYDLHYILLIVSIGILVSGQVS